jgi:hypothetical protein
MTSMVPRSDPGDHGPPSTDAARVSADQLAAAVITAIHRLAKQATLYEDDNETRVRQLQATQEAVRLYGTRTGRNFSAFWLQQSVFIGRRLLRAGRAVYAAALEVAEILRPLGIAQIVVGFDVPMEELRQLQEVFRALQRRMKPPVELLTFTRIRLRRSPDLDKRFVDEHGLSPRELAARSYAKAVVVMRRLLEEVQHGRPIMPIRVRRVGQQLIDVSSSAASELLGMAVLHNTRGDDASRAVNTAILAALMTRELGGDPRLLGRIAMAAMLCDVGKPRVAGTGPTGEARVGGIMPRLGEEQYAELPAATAAMMTLISGVSDVGMMQTAMVYEALHLQHADRLEPPYGGLRHPTVAGRIVAMARRFTELNADAELDPPRSPSEIMTILQLGAVDPLDLGVFRALASVLHIYPTGALVELSSHQVAQVLCSPADPAAFSRPVVGVLVEANGQRLPRPRELHLSQLEPADDAVHIVRVLALPSEAQLRAALARHEATRLLPGEAPEPPGGAVVDSQEVELVDEPRRPIEPAELEHALVPAESLPPPETRGPSTAPPPTPVEPRPSAPTPPPPSVEPRASAAPRRRALMPPDVPLDATGQAVAPTAEGTLVDAPLMDLTLYLTQHHFTGSLDVNGPAGERFVLYFDRGRPSKAYSKAQVAPLDRVLVEMKLVDFERLQRSIQLIAKSGQLHGEHLIAEGTITRYNLLEALRLQVVHKARAMFLLPPETRYAVYDGLNLLADYGGPELAPNDPLRIVMAGVRARPHALEVGAVIGQLGERPLAINPTVNIEGLGLMDDERRVEGLLRERPRPLRELLATEGLAPSVVRLTLYALTLAGALSFADEE